MPAQVPPRTSRACKACRSLKVRCLPSDEGDVCQKCARSGAECVFDEQRPRRKREQPDSRARVAALERKLEEVIAQVNQNHNVSQLGSNSTNDSNIAGQNSSASQSRKVWPKDVSVPTDRVDHLPTPESQHHGWTGHASDTPNSHKRSQSTADSAFSQYLGNGATPEALIAEGHLCVEDLERYIENFREMCSYFPFVLIPYDVTIITMLQDRPMLLHAAIAVATSAKVHLQKLLERSFKEIMLRRLMFESEKSIDLLQSILVFIAWGHFFHVPKRDQSYQLLQMAVGLCVDLGLNITPSFASQKVGLHLGHRYPSDNAEDNFFWSREARRAYLGCYYLSTMNNWIWAKPNTLAYSKYILQCAKSISEAPECPTDELILPLVQLQRVGDEYHETLRIGRNESSSQGLLDRIGTHIRSFHMRMQELRDNLSPTGAASTTVQLAAHFVSVHTEEQDLLSPFISINRRMVVGALIDSADDRIHCPSRIDILLDCLQAAAEYLDVFLTIPLSSYPLLGASQWSGLIYSLVVLYRLSIGTPRIPLWDVQAARDTVKLEKYLEEMCDRMEQVSRQRLRAIAETKQRDLYSVMWLVLRNVRNTYERLRHLPQEKSSTDGAPVHVTSFPDSIVDEELLPRPQVGPIFAQGRPISGYQNRCPAMQLWSSPEISVDNSTGCPGDDPFLNMNLIDDDGFWNQLDQAQWTTDLHMGVI